MCVIYSYIFMTLYSDPFQYSLYNIFTICPKRVKRNCQLTKPHRKLSSTNFDSTFGIRLRNCFEHIFVEKLCSHCTNIISENRHGFVIASFTAANLVVYRDYISS